MWTNNIWNTDYYLLRINTGENLTDSICSGLKLKKNKDSIEITDSIESKTLEEFLTAVPKHSPLIIHLEGNQVLTRISGEPGEELFEELDPDNFSLLTYKDLSWQISSAIRKTTEQSIKEFFQAKPFFLLHLSYGPSLLGLFREFDEIHSIATAGYRFTYRNGNITEVNKDDESDEEILIEDLKIKEKDTILLAGLLNIFQESLPIETAYQQNILSHSWFKKSRAILYSLLATILLVLIANFLVFSHLNSKVAELTVQGQLVNSKIETIRELEKELETYKSVFESSFQAKDQDFSKYLDMIAQNVPGGISLTGMVVNPELQTGRKDQPSNFDRQLILISGNTTGPVSLNSFIKNLKELEWIRDIKLEGYRTDNEERKAEFELKILK